MASTHELILDFIRHFSLHGEEVENCFLHGNCYWFSQILNERFTELDSVIMYDPIDNHFAWFYDGKIYDITGEASSPISHYIPWWKYQNYDPLESRRIYRDCIFQVSPELKICRYCERAIRDEYYNAICPIDKEMRLPNTICKYTN